MLNYFKSVCLVLGVVAWSFSNVLVDGMSYSAVEVEVVKKDSDSAPLKPKPLIHIPQVPDFPKFLSRPASKNQAKDKNNNNQQSNLPPLIQAPTYQQQLTSPIQSANVLAPTYQSYQDAGKEKVVAQNDGSKDKDNMQQYQHQVTFHEDTSSGHSIKNQTTVFNRDPVIEKVQESSQEFAIPYHVMQILNALGTGGSLAQASKPEKEKDGSPSGFTTAHAIGYATGDNATVNASVSNKMEVNTSTVILTESASASASSMSNGTAFSQATLSNNGWGQNTPGWPAGSGWSKGLGAKEPAMTSSN